MICLSLGRTVESQRIVRSIVETYVAVGLHEKNSFWRLDTEGSKVLRYTALSYSPQCIYYYSLFQYRTNRSDDTAISPWSRRPLLPFQNQSFPKLSTSTLPSLDIGRHSRYRASPRRVYTFRGDVLHFQITSHDDLIVHRQHTSQNRACRRTNRASSKSVRVCFCVLNNALRTTCRLSRVPVASRISGRCQSRVDGFLTLLRIPKETKFHEDDAISQWPKLSLSLVRGGRLRAHVSARAVRAQEINYVNIKRLSRYSFDIKIRPDGKLCRRGP
ncbi:hypothetical protein EVAR_54930_1 [Eumeta japonica]|uniref:Uncharacterized protein n=1 Tax=Eumeta variegata TaxID=151549 RepID=A0A4C1YAV2_EUMVA|nr:hypothetical protein EVAR_54930_1 [Eumeta japonica]